MRTPRLPSSHRPRLARAAAVPLVAAALLVAGCSGDDGGADVEADPQQVADGTTLEQTWPLTGLPVEGDETAEQRHPVIVLKMDNTESSAPQLGLGEADMVVEELVEGGQTRLAVFYYSQIPGDVGPVRSMRASDIGIVSPVDASVVTSGAANVTINRIQGADIPFFSEGAKGFYRDSSRAAPYNLFTDLSQTATLTHGEPARPDDYLPFGDAADLPKGKPATSIAASFGNHTTTWDYRGGGYTNVDTFAAQGDEFAADNVLVLRVEVGDAGYLDPAGSPVPETKFTGKGEALLFHGGEVVRGTWSKKSLTSSLTLSTKDGDLDVPAGHTWIELVPAATGDVSFTK